MTNNPSLVSIYWDYQNIPKGKQANKLLLFADSLGLVVTRKVYDNWQQKNKVDSKRTLVDLGFDCVTVSQTIKNAADFSLCIDCSGEVASSLYSHTFIIVSADGYGEVLIPKLQDKGKKVIILALRDKENKNLERLANEFYFLDELPSLVASLTQQQIDNSQCHLTYHEAVEYLIEAIQTALSKGKCAGLGLINQLMLQLFPKYQGVTSVCKHQGKTFSRFSELVKAAVKDGKIGFQNQQLFVI